MAIPFITPYVFESPLPLALMLVLGGAIACWIAVRSSQSGVLRGGIAAIILGVAVFVIGRLVVTPGEHASEVAHQLINAATNRDLVEIDSLLAPTAMLSLNSQTNPGISRSAIIDLADRSLRQFTISSNSIGGESIQTSDSMTGAVSLTCRTIVDGVPYPTLSSWLIRVQRQDDSRWLVTHITCVSINNQPASSIPGL
ncbi:MAG TPA: hypothetical protein VG711_01950 [Phycisphaerales bacterium]|nr:hypothetical protein [Phycisphaerales bacterium]